MRKILLFLITLLIFPLYSNEYKELFTTLSQEEIKELEDTSYLLKSGLDYKDGLLLIPDESNFREEFIKSVNEYKPDDIVEMLFMFDKPDLDGDQLTLFLQENILAVSEQEGIEYYSHNRGRMHPLIKKSYHVKSIGNKKRISDPKFINLKAKTIFTIYQKDTTLGGNYFSLLSSIGNGEIWNQQDNIHKLTVFGVYKVLDKKALRISYIIKPYGDKVVIYSLVQIKQPPKIKSILGLKVNMPDSIRKRIEAVMKWYIDRVKD